MEVNAATGGEPASLTEGDYKLVYDASNPDTRALLLTSVNGPPIRAGYDYRVKVTAKYLNGLTTESAVTKIRACAAPSLPPGVEWRPSVTSTATTSISLAWTSPASRAGLVQGCQVTGYRLYKSSDSGASFSEIDASQVSGDPNKHAHTTVATNFATADVGKTYLFKLEAANPVGTLPSATISAVLASPPATPTAAPTHDAARTSASQVVI
jgi:hypothetical protein